MAELRPYTPTWRDTVASWMMGQGQSSPERRAFVGGLLGSTGLGYTGVGVVDATPVGGLLSLQEASQAGDKTGMALASAGLIPGAGVAEKVAAKVAERSAPAAEKFITAYHGSPHSFDKFSLDKIGTGEGAQVYGHGLYFADNEGVAKAYRDGLAPGVVPAANGKRLSDMPDHERSVMNFMMRTGKSPADAADHFTQQALKDDEMLSALGMEVTAAGKDPRVEFAKSLIDKPTFGNVPEGHMYQVRINADPEHFLDWDKLASEQPEAVREAFLKMDKTVDVHGTQHTPHEPYETVGDWFKHHSSRVSQNEITDRMKAAGIPGIKYFDAGSRISGSPNTYTVQAMYKGKPYADAVKFEDKASADGYIARLKEDGFDHSFSEKKNEKTSNYVVFDDNLIDILKKYGLVGLLGGGAAMGASQQQQQGVPSL